MTEVAYSLHDLLPHRGSMLLLDAMVSVASSEAVSRVDISDASSFFRSGQGVPAWIGLEYMGQTAALIAGLQLKRGDIEPHVGLFLGTRKYQSQVEYFVPGQSLIVRSTEKAVAQGTMATFSATICDAVDETMPLAESVLSVYRQPIRG